VRILLVTHAYPPSLGGVQVHTRELAWALAGAGEEVHVLAREADAARPEFELRATWDAPLSGRSQGQVRVHWLNHTGRTSRDYADTYRPRGLPGPLATFLDELRPDLAHIHHLTTLSSELPGLLAARGVRVVLTLHDFWLLCHRAQLLDALGRPCSGPSPAGCARCLSVEGTGVGLEEALGPEWPTQASSQPLFEARAAALREACAQVELFLSPSADAKERFARWGVPAERILHVPHGHATRGPIARPRPLTLPLRIGFVGTLLPSKAPDLLIQAAAALPPGSVQVELWGAVAPHYHYDERYAARLRELLQGDHVVHHGPVGRPQVARALTELDVLAVPSIWPETGPLVVGEAFLAGVPCLVSDLGGQAEWVQEGVGGLRFRSGDAKDLTRVLRRLVDEPDLLPALRASIPEVKTQRARAARVRELYYELCSSPPPARRAPSTAAVVVDCATPDETAAAVSGLAGGARSPEQIFVVANGGRAAELRELLGEAAEVLDPGANLGFAGGANLGAQAALAAGAERMLFLNSDAVPEFEALERLAAEAEAAGAGIAGPLILDPAGRVESLGIGFQDWSGRIKLLKRGRRPEDIGPEVSAVDAVSGCALWVRRDVLEEVGLFAEELFFGFEDVDLCLRARAAGYRVCAVPRARVVHQGAASIGATSPARHYYATRNHLRVAQRAPGASALRSATVAGLSLAYSLSGRSGVSRRAGFGAAWRGLRDHLQGRYGQASEE
jgi:GT2 family glycosyltransferase/glycosyltransferase involved in cell wall biosynthesis